MTVRDRVLDLVRGVIDIKEASVTFVTRQVHDVSPNSPEFVEEETKTTVTLRAVTTTAVDK